jgi:UDP-N-acetylglucosamine--N-acetylmuramyl-(pentapeptide) pyrophosphoryl-undecaprenol N-acetylglucosamine transferase
MNVIIACGGTGGHLLPGLAVAEKLLSRGHRVRLLVSEKTVDQVALGALTSAYSRSSGALTVTPISAIGYTGLRHSMTFCYRLAQATNTCAAEYAAFQPDVVLGMGGFTSAPAVLAARWRGVPSLIHESNAVPGKANAWVGRFANRVALGLGECATHFGKCPATVTGTPIRANLRGGRVAGAAAQLGLVPGKLTVLVAGGSQGAHAVNEAVACALPWLDEWRARVQFVHLTGKSDEDFVRDSYTVNRFDAKVMNFCSQMELAYSAADLVVSRAGAATLTELAAFGLPALLIPYPHATGNHQFHNAQVFVKGGAAKLIEQHQLAGHHAATGERLSEALAKLLGDEEGRRRMGRAARSLAVLDAEEQIADLLESFGVRRLVGALPLTPRTGTAKRQQAGALQIT